MQQTIITWNVANWITVVLMALLGFVVVSFASQSYMKYKGSKASA